MRVSDPRRYAAMRTITANNAPPPPIICEISDSFANTGVEWGARLGNNDAKRDGLALHWISAAALALFNKPFMLQLCHRTVDCAARDAELLHQRGCAGQWLAVLALSAEDVRLKRIEDVSVFALRHCLFLSSPRIIP